jgi:RND family efflux transporter MFP subunit
LSLPDDQETDASFSDESEQLTSERVWNEVERTRERRHYRTPHLSDRPVKIHQLTLQYGISCAPARQAEAHPREALSGNRFGQPRSDRSAASRPRIGLRIFRFALMVLPLLLILGGCRKKEAAEPDIRPVRTVTVEPGDGAEMTTLTGEIRARHESDLGFRIDGKIIERPVDIGSTVSKGDLLARLDPQPRQQDLQSTRADAASAQATLVKNQAAEAREAQLLKDGFTPRSTYDEALANLRTAQSQVDSTTARLRQAEDNLSYTLLRADADGVITTVSANIGQVVSAGQAVVRLAQPGEREAVFDVSEAVLTASPKKPPVTVALASNPSINVVGSVRYVSPQADAKTRTYEVRISLPDAPPQMRLGATVTGSVSFQTAGAVELPGSALFQQDGKPAVWVVDQKTGTVSTKPISVERYSGDRMVLSGGLRKGDVVVTAGVQKLIAGQKVRLLEATSQ